MSTVVCVLRTGKRFIDGLPYRVEHVTKLRKGVAANLPLPHRFICLTDIPEDVTAAGVEAVPLPTAWNGWWSKINLFAPDLLTGPTLYFDLDTLIVGDISPLFRRTPGITMVADFYGPHMMNSSTMAWKGDFCGIWHTYASDPTGIAATYDSQRGSKIGDQGFIHDTLNACAQPIDTFDPAHVISFKQKAQHEIPPDARVLAFHGGDKMDGPASGWAYKMWSDL
jgi:hypothetical protein